MKNNIKSMTFLLFLLMGSNTLFAQETTNEAETDFTIVGKWEMYEDQDTNRFRATFIFKEGGEMVMIRNVKDQKKGTYLFDSEFMTLSISDPNGENVEISDVEVVNNDKVLIKGRHASGNKFTNLLLRQ